MEQISSRGRPPKIRRHGVGHGTLGRMARLLALDSLPILPAALDELASLADDGRLDASDPEVVLLSPHADLTAEQVAGWPSLRHVAVAGTSLKRIDLDALEARGVAVSNVSHYGDSPVGEVLLMHLVRLARGVDSPAWRGGNHELAGVRVVVIGMGPLGRSLLPVLRAVDADVSYIARTPKDDVDARFGTRAELLPQADVVVLAGPTDTEMLSADDFAALRDDVILVQLSIGHAVDAAAFEEWLARPGNLAVLEGVVDAGERGRYGARDNVVVSDRSAGLSQEATGRLGDAVVANVRAALAD